jgi:hypothetical protein
MTEEAWPTEDEIKAMSPDEREDTAFRILEVLNDSRSPMVGPFRRWDDEVDLFAYLDELGIVHDSDAGRFIFME